MDWGAIKSCRKCFNQVISQVVVVIAWYLASLVDLDTVFYFFDFHEISDWLRNTQISVIDFLVSWHAAQLASQNALSYRSLDERKNRPSPVFLLICLRTGWAAAK